VRKDDDTPKPRAKQRPHLRLVSGGSSASAPPAQLDFSFADWTPASEAFARAKALLFSPSLAAHDVCAHLIAGRLRAATRLTDGAHQSFDARPASYWRGVSPSPGMFAPQTVVKRAAPKPPSSTWAIFVARSDLDRLYPIGHSIPETGQAGRARKRRRSFVGRRRGKRPIHDWPLFVAAEVIRRAKAGESDPTAAAMIQHCESTLPGAFSPGLKEMQIILKLLLSRRS
jgi:hypothetical protein